MAPRDAQLAGDGGTDAGATAGDHRDQAGEVADGRRSRGGLEPLSRRAQPADPELDDVTGAEVRLVPASPARHRPASPC